MPNITNAQVNAASAAIPVLAFGPATRITNVESPQLDNTQNFVVTVPFGYDNISSVTLNYDQLTNATNSKRIIFAAVIDDFAAAIVAPYGPLTRVTPVASLGINASNARDVPIEFTLTSPYNTEKVSLTYNELRNAPLVNGRLQGAVGSQFLVNRLKTQIGALNTLAAAMTAPHTEADYVALIESLRDLNYLVGGFRLN